MMDAAILVVEDELLVRKMLAAALARTGVEIDTAADGAEALEKMAARDYALVLMDLMLPRVNGFEVVDRMSKWTRRPMVFVMTASPAGWTGELPADIVHLIVRKPFDVEMLVAVASACVAARPVARIPPVPPDGRRRPTERESC